MSEQPRGNRKPRPPLNLPGGTGRTRPGRQMAFWVVLFLVLLLSFQHWMNGKANPEKITYSQLTREIDAGNIKEITFIEKEARGEFTEPRPLTVGLAQKNVRHFKVNLPFADPALLTKVQDKNPTAVISGERSQGNWMGYVFSGLPILLLFLVWLFIFRQMQGGGNRAFNFGKSRAKLVDGDRPKVTFEDVAGAEEAKTELQEIVEFLRDPKKFQRLGGRIPKGALLLGPPGTGKTLLARAVAGEASVSFFSMSGSDFVEMFVGVGASRVRDLFENGKKQAPCIIFIDEIDAVGRHRGAGLGGGHDEREQTLNQLLVEMDGFESNDGVILLAATNRPDVLDPALLRPGRFDRQIVVDMPDVRGREGILKVHSKNVPMAPDVDLRRIARGTPGFSGADLANLVNEAALLAARRNTDKVTNFDLEEAKDKVMMGPERKSRVISEETRRMVAYHEAGHAIAAFNLEHADPLHKVTIIPRGRAGGVTYTLPENDRDEVSRDWCMDTVTMAMGGRVAEKLIMGRIGSGAQSDITQATKTARRMVTRWGMSDTLGPVAYGEGEDQVFLGREFGHRREFSEATAQKIDDEVSRIIDECYKRAEKILTEHVDQLHLLAKTLLERETVDGDELRRLIAGEELPPVRSIATSTPSDGTAAGNGAAADAAGAPSAKAPSPERPNTAVASQNNPPEHPNPAAS